MVVTQDGDDFQCGLTQRKRAGTFKKIRSGPPKFSHHLARSIPAASVDGSARRFLQRQSGSLTRSLTRMVLTSGGRGPPPKPCRIFPFRILWRPAVAFKDTRERLINHACSDSVLICLIVIRPGAWRWRSGPPTRSATNGDTNRHDDPAEPKRTATATTGKAIASPRRTRWSRITRLTSAVRAEIHRDRGKMPIKNRDGETEANLFMAHARFAPGDRNARPLTFSFNGGPGQLQSGCIWVASDRVEFR
jgi:hypothetical protein